MNTKFREIVTLFRKLPGVGPRQAARFVIALMDKPEAELEELGKAIQNLRKEISFCGTCFNISSNHLCSVCSDNKRDQGKILIVEKITDLDSIEKTGLYKGLYHVLGGAINPLDGVLPETLKIAQLEDRISDFINAGKKVELIIATNPNTAGETTSLFLRDTFHNRPGITITRLARGLASGSNLEYADELTLKHALEYRK